MTWSALDLDLRPLPAPLPVRHGLVDGHDWIAAARAVAARGDRLVSLWAHHAQSPGAGISACAAYAGPEGLVWLELPLDLAATGYPDLSALFP